MIENQKKDIQNDVFIPIDEYNGDIIWIDRLAEFFPDKTMAWNDGESVSLDDISYALNSHMTGESEPYGDTWNYTDVKNKSTKWHIGRVMYFVNHPEEIRDIEIDNVVNGFQILPIPIIVDGNHRFMAAMWLHNQGEMVKVHCRYGGRVDLLDWLSGKSDILPTE